MRIAVLSDTHMNSPDQWFASVWERYCEPADYVIHCGDVTGEAMYYFMSGHPGFYGVAGNMDQWTLGDTLPDTVRLELDGLRIAAAHGWGSRMTLAETVVSAVGHDRDLVCYGHSHIWDWRVVNGVRVLNPGSLTSPRSGGRSLALVDWADGELSVRRVDLSSD